MQLQEALQAFLLQLSADGRSSHTSAQYNRHCGTLIEWVITNGTGANVGDLTPELLARFFADGVAKTSCRGGPKKAVSLNAMRTSVRCFCAHLHDAGMVADLGTAGVTTRFRWHTGCMSRRAFTMFAPAAACGAALALALPGQRTSNPMDLAAEAARDPYTRNDPGRMKALGYVSFGPFHWNLTSTSTADLRSTLGEPRIRFIETAHFRLGCAMAPRKLPSDTRPRRMVVKELQQLRKSLPRVPRTVRTLDRWLLTHLYAQRLENLYADFSALLGVDESDFPPPERTGKSGQPGSRGRGRYLGQRDKFCVILFDAETQLLRYLKAFADYKGKVAGPRRHDFTKIGSLGFATASQCGSGALFDDAQMHAHVVSEVAKNLAIGYKAHLVQLPSWFIEGLGHYYGRGIDPKISRLDETVDPNRLAGRAWDWGRRVRARVRKEHYPNAEQLFDSHVFTEWGVQEHMMAWSRFDFLMQKDVKGIRRFLDYFNDLEKPIQNANGPGQRSHHVASMQKAWNLTFAEFDKQWKKFVLTKYRR